MPGNISDNANRTRRLDSRSLQREASIARDSDNNLSPATPPAHASELDQNLVTQQLAEEVATSALDNPEEDTIDFYNQPAADFSNHSSSANSSTSGNNSVIRQIQFPIMAQIDINGFQADLKHFLREFGLGHQAADPFALFCANRAYTTVNNLLEEDLSDLADELDNGYSTATNSDIPFVRVPRLRF